MRPPLGKPSVGMQVVVHVPLDKRQYDGTVTKVGRTWITVTTDRSYLPEFRFRIDTQTDGSQYTGSSCSFLTVEQEEHARRASADDQVLRDAIGWNLEGTWGRDEDRRAMLADFIRQTEEREAKEARA